MSKIIWNHMGGSIAASLIGGLAMLCASTVSAESYPERPVTLVVGFPPNGSTDVVARILAEHMSATLGEPVLVENRPGAGGTVGIDMLRLQPLMDTP